VALPFCAGQAKLAGLGGGASDCGAEANMGKMLAAA